MPNVFVLCTGRCGSVTFANACKHITNYSCGHETRVREMGDARTNFPRNHIEVDNRLIFFDGALERKYGDDAVYVHLRRDPTEVADSYNKRWNMADGLITGWATSIARQTDYGISASQFMVDTIEENIGQFLSNKTRKLEIWIENIQEGFDEFADLIGAEGDRSAMRATLGDRHNVNPVSNSVGDSNEGPEVFLTLDGLFRIITEQRKELASAKMAEQRSRREISEMRRSFAELERENRDATREIASLGLEIGEAEQRLDELKSSSEREAARLNNINRHNKDLIERLFQKLRSPLKLTEALLKTAVPRKLKKKKTVNLEEARRCVAASETPAQEIIKLYSGSEINLQTAGELIGLIFSDRKSESFTRMVDQEASFQEPELRIMHKLYLGDYRGKIADVDEVRSDWLAMAGSDYRLTNANQLYFLLAAIKSGSLSLVDMILKDAAALSPDDLPSTYKTGILRLAAATSREDYEMWRLTVRPTPLEALKIAEIDVAAGHEHDLTHNASIQRFSETVPAHLRHELKSSIAPFFERHQARMRWMDCRLNAEVRLAFLEHIKEKLQSGQPWSLVRLGDGESYAWQGALPSDWVAMRERVWWGEELDQELRHEISGRILDAITQADVLGVPSIFRFIRDTTENLKSYREHHSISGLLHVLEGVDSLPESEREFTEDRIHQVCFDLPSIIGIAREARKIIIVSSILPNRLKPTLEKHIESAEIDYALVPTHTKTKGNEQYVVSNRPLPFLYEKIDAELAEKVKAKTLVIVAAGSIGKIFCETVRRSGGVALDVGSMMDYWVGVKTRSVADII